MITVRLFTLNCDSEFRREINCQAFVVKIFEGAPMHCRIVCIYIFAKDLKMFMGGLSIYNRSGPKREP